MPKKITIVHVNSGAELDIVKTIIKNPPLCWGSSEQIEVTINPKDATVGFHYFVKTYLDDSDTVGVVEIPADQ